MAVVTTKSTAIANRDAVQKVLTDPFIAGGSTTEAYGFVAAAVGDSINSAYKMMSVPSNARVSSLRLANGALGTSVTVDVGVFYPTTLPLGGGSFLSPALAGTLITSSAIAAGTAVSSANATFVDLISTATLSLDKQEMPLWQMIGMAADPECNLDLGYVVKGAAVGTAGQIAMKAIYAF